MKKVTTTQTTSKVQLTIEEQIKFTLQKDVERNEKLIADDKAKMMDNFLYYMPWNAEDLYKKIYITEYYKAMLFDMDKYTVLEVVKEWIERMEGYINQSYNVRENSTGSLFRETSTWKFVCNMEMLKYLKAISK